MQNFVSRCKQDVRCLQDRLRCRSKLVKERQNSSAESVLSPCSKLPSIVSTWYLL